MATVSTKVKRSYNSSNDHMDSHFKPITKYSFENIIQEQSKRYVVASNVTLYPDGNHMVAKFFGASFTSNNLEEAVNKAVYIAIHDHYPLSIYDTEDNCREICNTTEYAYHDKTFNHHGREYVEPFLTRNDLSGWHFIGSFAKVSESQFYKDVNSAQEINKYWGISYGYENIQAPKRSTHGSAGYDFFCPFNVSSNILKGQSFIIPTGIRCRMDPGYFLAIYPRSGMGFTYRVQLANTVGIIDSDYYYSENEGHIILKMIFEGYDNDAEQSHTMQIKAGDKIAQGIFQKHFLADNDLLNADMKTRNGGFGSTSR